MNAHILLQMGRKVHTSFDTCFLFSLDVIEEKYSFRKKFITLMTIISRYPDKMFIYLANFLSYDVLFLETYDLTVSTI